MAALVAAHRIRPASEGMDANGCRLSVTPQRVSNSALGAELLWPPVRVKSRWKLTRKRAYARNIGRGCSRLDFLATPFWAMPKGGGGTVAGKLGNEIRRWLSVPLESIGGNWWDHFRRNIC